jgi:hypothetical protein
MPRSTDPYLQSDADFAGILGEVNAGFLKGFFAFLSRVEKFPFTIPSFCSMRCKVASRTFYAKTELKALMPEEARETWARRARQAFEIRCSHL